MDKVSKQGRWKIYFRVDSNASQPLKVEHFPLTDCLYKLTEEPLLVLPCNPYTSDGIMLHCTVRTPDFSVTIQWIWQADSSSELIELDSSDMNVTIDNMYLSVFDGIRSRLNVKNLINRVGMFWCRAILTNGTQLEDSSKWTLFNQNVYENDMNCTNEELSERSSTGRCINAASSVAETPPLLGMDQITSSMAGNETTPPAPDSLGPTLYAVIAVILLFCLVIVTLTVTFVLLYRRRKCGRKTAGELTWTVPCNQSIIVIFCVHSYID